MDKGGVIDHARRLLHVVSDDDHGIFGFEIVVQLFNGRGRDRIER